jgi:hypothetical protein
MEANAISNSSLIKTEHKRGRLKEELLGNDALSMRAILDAITIRCGKRIDFASHYPLCLYGYYPPPGV